MPVHRVLITELEDKVDEIERSERVVSTERHGDVVLVFTEPKSSRRKAGESETR